MFKTHCTQCGKTGNFLTWKIFRETTLQCNSIMNSVFPRRVRRRRNLRTFPPIFCKSSVKLTFSLKSYTVNQFDEKFLQWGKIPEITTVCCSHLKIFREINSLVFGINAMLLSRNFFIKQLWKYVRNFL